MLLRIFASLILSHFKIFYISFPRLTYIWHIQRSAIYAPRNNNATCNNDILKDNYPLYYTIHLSTIYQSSMQSISLGHPASWAMRSGRILYVYAWVGIALFTTAVQTHTPESPELHCICTGGNTGGNYMHIPFKMSGVSARWIHGGSRSTALYKMVA